MSLNEEAIYLIERRGIGKGTWQRTGDTIWTSLEDASEWVAAENETDSLYEFRVAKFVRSRTKP